MLDSWREEFRSHLDCINGMANFQVDFDQEMTLYHEHPYDPEQAALTLMRQVRQADWKLPE